MKTALQLAFKEMRKQDLKAEYTAVLDLLENDERMHDAWAEAVPSIVPEANLFQLLEAILQAKLTIDQQPALTRIASGAPLELASLGISADNLLHFLTRLQTVQAKPDEVYGEDLLALIPQIPSMIKEIHKAKSLIQLMNEGLSEAINPIISSSRKKQRHCDTMFANRLCTILDIRFCSPNHKFTGAICKCPSGNSLSHWNHM